MGLGYEIERLIVRVVGDTQAYQAPISQAVDATRSFGRAVAGTAAGAGKAFAVLTAPVAAFAAASGRSAAAFERTMSQVTGLIGISREQTEAWAQDLLDLAPQVGKSPEELSKAMFFIASAGLRGQKALDALRESARASAAGLGDTVVVADAVTSAVNAYAKTGLTSAEATDVLTAAVREGKLEAATLAPVIGRITPLASAMGVSFGEALGPMAAMTRTGASAAESGVALQAFFSTLMKPAKQSIAKLAEYNLSFEQLREVVRGPNGVTNVMRMLDAAFQGNTSEMARVFPNIRALRGVMNLLSQDGATVSSILDGVRNATGSMDAAFAAAAGTSSFKMEQRLANLQVGMVAFGKTVKEVLSPAMAAFGESLRAAVLWWRGLDDSTRKTIVRWAVAATAAVSLMAAIKGLSMLLGMLKLGQLASATLWAAWSAGVLVAKVAAGALGAVLALLKIGMTGNVIAGMAWWFLAVTATAATWAWNAALFVLNALLSPAAILGTALVVAGLGVAFTAAAGAVLGLVQAGGALFGTLRGLPTVYGPIQHIGGLFREWGAILGEVWTLMQTDGPAAWRLFAAAASLAFAQVQALLPPLWQFIKEGFFILWDMVVTTFDAKFTATVQKAKLQLGVLYGMSERTAKEQQKLDESAAFARQAAADRAAARLDKLAGNFRVPETEAIRSARGALDAVRNEVATANLWAPLLDDAEAELNEILGPIGSGPAHAIQKSFEKAGAGVDLVTKKGKAMKDALRPDAVDFFSAEAQSRLDAYREAFAPSLRGSPASKSEEYLKRIAENTQRSADDPEVEFEPAEFDAE